MKMIKLIIDSISDYNAILLANLSEDLILDKLVITIPKENDFGINKLLNVGFIQKKETKKYLYLIYKKNKNKKQ